MENVASDKEEEHGWLLRAMGRGVAWLAVIFLIYFLSVGPVILVVHTRGLPLRASIAGRILVIYAPLEWAYALTPLRKPIGMYLHLWYPKGFAADGEPNPGK
jgi:hypothetical protein